MDSAAVIRSFQALMGADDDPIEVAEAFLLAAAYVLAVRDETTPRDVADRLFKAMPSTAAWPTVRDSLLLILDE